MLRGLGIGAGAAELRSARQAVWAPKGFGAGEGRGPGPACRFDYGWDQRLIDEYEKLKDCSPKPVMSTYPPAISQVGGFTYR